MNITFLIGNGFDIGVGMKSRFRDFFPIYQALSLKKEARIKQLSEEIDENYDNWSDFEVALGEYTAHFNKETKQNFLDQLEDFEKEFIEYLNKQESCLSFHRTDEICSIMIPALQQFYSADILEPISNSQINKIFNAHRTEPHKYNFINFNYTTILEKCISEIPQKIVCKRKSGEKEIIDKIDRVVHIHGKYETYPIIGVNDVSQIVNKELANDTRFVQKLVKPTVNQLLRQGNDENSTDLINTSTVLCVYGMSFGATDKKWWDLILRWLHNNGERQLVIFNYDDKFSARTPFGKLSKEDYYIDKFDEYKSISTLNVESLRSRIHIVVNKNIFAIDLAKEYNEAWDKVVEEFTNNSQSNGDSDNNMVLPFDRGKIVVV